MEFWVLQEWYFIDTSSMLFVHVVRLFVCQCSCVVLFINRFSSLPVWSILPLATCAAKICVFLLEAEKSPNEVYSHFSKTSCIYQRWKLHQFCHRNEKVANVKFLCIEDFRLRCFVISDILSSVNKY